MSQLREQLIAAREASYALAKLSRVEKDAALTTLAAALLAAQDTILAANAHDVAAQVALGTAEALIDRLLLTHTRVASIAAGLNALADLPDPVGDVVREWDTPLGVHISQIRVPFGVVGIVYEARPGVTADAAGICLKSGNACVLRGSASAYTTNNAIVTALQEGLIQAGLPPYAIQLVAGDHLVTTELMQARGLVDVLIPRGGAGLINAVVAGATVPVIETGTGNCHLFVDASADQQLALTVALNAKTQRPSVCNALETMLVHRSIAPVFIPQLIAAMNAAGVTIHGDPAACAIDARIVPATEHEYVAEYLSLDLALAVVSDLDAAIAHIRRYGTGHSETIITQDEANALRFTTEVDAAAVLVNTSSRFVDGGEFGFGAEIGISTQKLHARGPMALPEMTTTKYVLVGSGQIRP
ncbi:MAG: glutamate-5-semialdehyde dehydrogenase [Propionibacteriaceae bacterium]|jgi:glutamate-5-semialdehyde dehydrogenase|nr:glutamate-5-semialdehyde dehydrogenase [Propionibacteriaceae bacterium]